MTRQEDNLAGRIDRERERLAAKPARDARRAQVREMARATFNCAVLEHEDPADRLEYVKATATRARELYATIQDDAGACAFFGSLAHAHESTLPRAIAAARAEQLFTNAANDEARHD